MSTYVENLKQKLDELNTLVFELLDNSRIKRFVNDPNSELVFILPKYYWDNATDKEQQIQNKIRPKYNRWIESFKVLTDNLAEPTKEKLKETDVFVNNWINKHGEDWNVPKRIEEAKEKYIEEVKIFFDTLEMLNKSGNKETMVIPDTNSLINFPDPVLYKQLSTSDSFTIILVPTVLNELDELKVRSNNQDFRDKVKSIIRRIKGYRTQGSLLDGVKAHGTITIRMIATEPDIDKSLSWLTETNNDDRVLASALEIQKEYPSSKIVIATGDINLQNKCEMANFPYGELEEK